MKDQQIKLGTLLQSLRQKFPYTLEEWATLFEVSPATIQQIEQGIVANVPLEFWGALVKWTLNILDNTPPANDLPTQLLAILRDVQQQQQTVEVQSQHIAFDTQSREWHQEHLEFYKKVIAQQKQQIEKLKQQHFATQRTTTGKVKGKAAKLSSVAS
jgi:transcriptional regulator with XRE-family HTH domain